MAGAGMDAASRQVMGALAAVRLVGQPKDGEEAKAWRERAVAEALARAEAAAEEARRAADRLLAGDPNWLREAAVPAGGPAQATPTPQEIAQRLSAASDKEAMRRVRAGSRPARKERECAASARPAAHSSEPTCRRRLLPQAEAAIQEASKASGKLMDVLLARWRTPLSPRSRAPPESPAAAAAAAADADGASAAAFCAPTSQASRAAGDAISPQVLQALEELPPSPEFDDDTYDPVRRGGL